VGGLSGGARGVGGLSPSGKLFSVLIEFSLDERYHAHDFFRRGLARQ